jgi:glycosyltransferase involved in cell wall biosynthesis
VFIAGRDFNLFRSRMPVMQELARRGWEVHGVASGTDKFRSLLEQAGIHFHDAPFYRHKISLKYDLQARAVVSRVFSQVQPTIVHCFNPKPLFLTAGPFPILRKEHKNFCTITGAGFVQSNSFRAKVLRLLYARIISRFDSIMFENKSDAAAFQEYASVRRRPYQVQISSGVDMALYDLPRPRPSEKVRFLFASRLLWSKGIKELLEASSRLAQVRPGAFEVIIAGELENDHSEGVPKSVLETANENPNIRFLGHVALEDMPKTIMAADVIVLPSYREGFSKILMEGAAAGKALIASDIPGCQEAVVDRFNGFLVPSRSASALHNAMLNFVNDREQLVTMGKRSYLKAKAEFDQSHIVENTLKFYTDAGIKL